MEDNFAAHMEDLIAEAHSVEAAAGYSACVPTMGALSKIWMAGRQVISTAPEQAAACVPMTALLLRHLGDELRGQLFVVAGSLQAADRDGTFIFGGPEPMDCRRLFAESDASWNGHLWLMFGPYIADISFTRSVRLDGKRDTLKAFARKLFGDADEPVICRRDQLRTKGLIYWPQCVLSQSQAVRLMAVAAFG
jgi:hypothetical protein